MIPKDSDIEELFTDDFETVVAPAKTYRMRINQERVQGVIDGREALKQMIYKQINTEPSYPIYANFGVKKRDLFGKPKTYAYMEIIRRIEEALTLDDRIIRCRNFFYREDMSQGNDLGFTFTVVSIYGEIDIEEVMFFGN